MQQSYSEDENVGTFSVCVSVTMPPDTEPLNRNVTLRVDSRPGTAGMSLKLFFSFGKIDSSDVARPRMMPRHNTVIQHF